MLDILNGKEIYDKVDALRLEKGWTIYELAMKAGVAPRLFIIGEIGCLRLLYRCLMPFVSLSAYSVIDFLLDADDLMALTEEQREVIRLWNTLSSEQKKSILNLMKSM